MLTEGYMMIEGGHASVHQCGDYAVKKAALEDTSIEAFLFKEYTLVQSLNHPNIIRFQALDVDRDTAVIRMPWYSLSLSNWIAENDFDHRLALFDHIFSRLLDAVAEVHRNGVIHLDIKPSNVMMKGVEPILIDFSAAVHVASPSTDYATPDQYSPPEVITHQPVTSAADVYMIAVTMMEYLWLEEIPEDITAAVVQLNNPLALWIPPMLSKDPALRPLISTILNRPEPKVEPLWWPAPAVQLLSIAPAIERYLAPMPTWDAAKKEAVTFDQLCRLAATAVPLDAADTTKVAALVFMQELFDAFYYDTELLCALFGASRGQLYQDMAVIARSVSSPTWSTPAGSGDPRSQR